MASAGVATCATSPWRVTSCLDLSGTPYALCLRSGLWVGPASMVLYEACEAVRSAKGLARAAGQGDCIERLLRPERTTQLVLLLWSPPEVLGIVSVLVEER